MIRAAGWLLVILLGISWMPAAGASGPRASGRSDCGAAAVLPLKAVEDVSGSVSAYDGGGTQRAAFSGGWGNMDGILSLPQDYLVMLSFALCALLMLLLALLLAVRSDHRKRRLLAELNERDRRLNDLMELLPGGVCIFGMDEEGRMRADYLNQGFCRMIDEDGADLKELIRRDLTDWAHPKDRSGMLAELERASLENDGYCDTFRLRKRDGSYFWVTLRGTPVGMQNGRRTYYGIFTNVDAIKEMQERLEENEESMRTAMTQAGMNYWEYDPERHLVHCDEYSQKMLGVPEWMEDYPDSWFHRGITHPEDVPLLRQALREIDAGAAAASCEVRERTVDQTYRWMKVCLTSLYDWSGRRVKVLSTGMDITRQKEAEAVYAQRLEQLRAAMPNAVASFRLDLTQNSCLESFSNYPDQLVGAGSSADEFFEAMAARIATEQEQAACRQSFSRPNLMQAFESGAEEPPVECRYRVGERIRWISIRTRLDRNPATGRVEALIYAFSIDKRKWVQQMASSILRSQYLLSARIDLARNTVRLYDAQNGGFLEEHDCSPEDLERYVRQLYAGADPGEFLRKISFQEVERLLEDGGEYVVYGDLVLGGRQVRAKGVYSWMDRRQRTACFVLSDITDVFREEQNRTRELSRALSAAEEANRAKSVFLSRMSHEIRTPLSAILGLAQIGKSETGDDAALEDFDKILLAGEYLLGLLNDVLDMSRIENGKILLHPENTATAEFIASILTIAMPQMKRKQIRFTLNTSGTATEYVVIDRIRVRQIYINLLNNAAKFSAPGTSIECGIHYEPAGEDAVAATVVVRDHGCGMSEEFLKRIFIPFEQEHNRYSDSQPGTGLGLAIMKNLVDQMGGTIQVESRPEQGTVFTVTLTVPKGRPPEPDALSTPTEAAGEIRGLRVLLAEDQPINVEIVRKLLEKQGVLLEYAQDGQAAVNLYLSHPSGYFDAVLMDIRMPVLNGMEAAREIRASGRADAPSLRIIAMTADAFESDRRELMAAEIHEYLIKPFRAQELYEILCPRDGRTGV